MYMEYYIYGIRYAMQRNTDSAYNFEVVHVARRRALVPLTPQLLPCANILGKYFVMIRL